MLPIKEYKKKLNRNMVEALSNYLKQLVIDNSHEVAVEDMLLLATLAELHNKLEKRLASNYKTAYALKLEATYALALVQLYEGYVNDSSSYLGNCLHGMRNEILQKYC